MSLRVVRVGTHALRPSKTTLWQRLCQHKGSAGGALAGGGNHRGSVFRRHVGTALLASGEWPEAVRRSWLVGNTAKGLVRAAEHPLEVAVSERIGAMPFLWLEVDGPDGQADRAAIERGAIALLSNFRREAVDPPSKGWLGRHAHAEDVRESGLWNVEHVREQPDGSFLDLLAKTVAAGEPEARQER